MRSETDQMRDEYRYLHEDEERAIRVGPAEQPKWVPKYTPAELEDAACRMQRGLAERGWYMSFGQLTLDATVNLARHMDTVSPADLEQDLVKYARTRVDEVQRDVKKHWPSRAHILDDAFSGHRNAVYTLSIPAMLAQADGLCQELLGAQMFGKERSTPTSPRTAAALDKSLASITYAGKRINVSLAEKIRLGSLRLLNGLSENTAARDQLKTCGQEVSPLNRHGVLHGLDVDYPNEANSLRCILLLDFLNDVRQTLDFLTDKAAEWEALLRDRHAWLMARDNADRLHWGTGK